MNKDARKLELKRKKAGSGGLRGAERDSFFVGAS